MMDRIVLGWQLVEITGCTKHNNGLRTLPIYTINPGSGVYFDNSENALIRTVIIFNINSRKVRK